MTRIICISNLKGGQAKTTTAVNLAHCLTQHEQRVLLIDTDVQGQVTKSLGVTPHYGLSHLINGDDIDIWQTLYQARPELYVLAGGNSLAGLSREIARTDFRSEWILADAIAPLHEYFDFILIDTPPGYSPILINALLCATEVLAPVTLQSMSLQGLVALTQRIQQIRRHQAINLTYVLPTMVDRRYAATAEIMAELKTHYGTTVCEPIRTDARMSEAPAFGQTIFEYAPGSNASTDYKTFTTKVLTHEQA